MVFISILETIACHDLADYIVIAIEPCDIVQRYTILAMYSFYGCMQLRSCQNHKCTCWSGSSGAWVKYLLLDRNTGAALSRPIRASRSKWVPSRSPRAPSIVSSAATLQRAAQSRDPQPSFPRELPHPEPTERSKFIPKLFQYSLTLLPACHTENLTINCKQHV